MRTFGTYSPASPSSVLANEAFSTNAPTLEQMEDELELILSSPQSEAWFEESCNFDDLKTRKILLETPVTLKRELEDAAVSKSKKPRCSVSETADFFDEEIDFGDFSSADVGADDSFEGIGVSDFGTMSVTIDGEHSVALDGFMPFGQALNIDAMMPASPSFSDSTFNVDDDAGQQHGADFMQLPSPGSSEYDDSSETNSLARDMRTSSRTAPNSSPPVSKSSTPSSSSKSSRSKRARLTVGEKRVRMEQRSHDLDARNTFLKSEIQLATSELIKCKKLISLLFKKEEEKRRMLGLGDNLALDNTSVVPF